MFFGSLNLNICSANIVNIGYMKTNLNAQLKYSLYILKIFNYTIFFLAKMVSTKTLVDLLHECGVPTDENISTILSHLRKIAVLVQGNWTIKSEELYPDNSISFHFGLNFDVMRLLRDYIVRHCIQLLLIYSMFEILLFLFIIICRTWNLFVFHIRNKSLYKNFSDLQCVLVCKNAKPKFNFEFQLISLFSTNQWRAADNQILR